MSRKGLLIVFFLLPMALSAQWNEWGGSAAPKYALVGTGRQCIEIVDLMTWNICMLPSQPDGDYAVDAIVYFPGLRRAFAVFHEFQPDTSFSGELFPGLIDLDNLTVAKWSHRYEPLPFGRNYIKGLMSPDDPQAVYAMFSDLYDFDSAPSNYDNEIAKSDQVTLARYDVKKGSWSKVALPASFEGFQRIPDGLYSMPWAWREGVKGKAANNPKVSSQGLRIEMAAMNEVERVCKLLATKGLIENASPTRPEEGVLYLSEEYALVRGPKGIAVLAREGDNFSVKALSPPFFTRHYGEFRGKPLPGEDVHRHLGRPFTCGAIGAVALISEELPAAKACIAQQRPVFVDSDRISVYADNNEEGKSIVEGLKGAVEPNAVIFVDPGEGQCRECNGWCIASTDGSFKLAINSKQGNAVWVTVNPPGTKQNLPPAVSVRTVNFIANWKAAHKP